MFTQHDFFLGLIQKHYEKLHTPTFIYCLELRIFIRSSNRRLLLMRDLLKVQSIAVLAFIAHFTWQKEVSGIYFLFPKCIS